MFFPQIEFKTIGHMVLTRQTLNYGNQFDSAELSVNGYDVAA